MDAVAAVEMSLALDQMGAGFFCCCCSDVSASYNETDNVDIKAGVKAGALVLQAPAAQPTITEEIKMPVLSFTPIVLLQLTFLAGLHGKSFDWGQNV